MSDDDLMPFGKYKGQKMSEVPDDYLMWFYRENYGHHRRGRTFYGQKAVMNYIEDSFNESELNKHII